MKFFALFDVTVLFAIATTANGSDRSPIETKSLGSEFVATKAAKKNARDAGNDFSKAAKKNARNGNYTKPNLGKDTEGVNEGITDLNCDPETEQICYDDQQNPLSCAEKGEVCTCPDGLEPCGSNSYWVGWCTAVCCDELTEEACFDGDGNVLSCAKKGETCTCPDPLVSCGGGLGWAGWCAKACCDVGEEMCFDDDNQAMSCAKLSEGGCTCKPNEVKCGADLSYDYPGYCSDVCCDDETEDTCYDDSGNPLSCVEKGESCTCPDGLELCMTWGWGSGGRCTKACCDPTTEETCYDEDYKEDSCALIAEGGCPCKPGEVKCNGNCAEVCCDESKEETCYDHFWNGVACAKIEDGGCPCREWEVKCGASNGYAGYCTTLCCDVDTEETCYDQQTYLPVSCAKIEDGGCPCPDGEVKCGASDGYAGYCTPLCCDDNTEELCYDQQTYRPVSCAKIEDGGCPCPAGEVKCGASPGYAGYCTSLCCDENTEEKCYNEQTGEGVSCAKIADGGCPCSDGEIKCGSTLGYAGWCAPICCDQFTEETCYDEFTYEPISCANIAEGGCPCPEGDVKCGAYPGYAGWCTPACCDDETEETCYDESGWDPVSCAEISKGGCP